MDNKKLENLELTPLMCFLLGRLESRVGCRSDKVPLRPPRYDDRDGPVAVFHKDSSKQVLLTLSTKKYPQQRIFQMSHEVVHLLQPHETVDDWKKTTCLEEGFATFNSIYECSRSFPGYNAREKISGGYSECLQILEKVGNEDDVFNFVKAIRDKGFELSNVSKDTLMCITTKLNECEVSFLLNKFKWYKN